MVALALALLLAAQASPAQESTEVAPLLIQPRGEQSGPVPTEQDIVSSLNDLVQAQPDRVVCIPRDVMGSRLKANQCATLRHWYDINVARNVQRKVAAAGPPATHGFYVNEAGPPYELVNMLTQRYRNPHSRERAALRAVMAKQPTSPADPPISNP